MDKPLLDDKNQHPTEAIIFPLIGRSKAGWRVLFDHLVDAHPDFESTWRFYKDGGRWLLKTTRKSKTIFWLSVTARQIRSAASSAPGMADGSAKSCRLG